MLQDYLRMSNMLIFHPIHCQLAVDEMNYYNPFSTDYTYALCVHFKHVSMQWSHLNYIGLHQTNIESSYIQTFPFDILYVFQVVILETISLYSAAQSQLYIFPIVDHILHYCLMSMITLFYCLASILGAARFELSHCFVSCRVSASLGLTCPYKTSFSLRCDKAGSAFLPGSQFSSSVTY